VVILRLSNYLEIENPPASLEKWLEGFCVFKTTNYANNDDIPPILNLFQKDGNTISVPRGLLETVRERLSVGHCAFTLEDLTTKPEHFDFKINPEIKYKTGIFSFQKRAVDELKKFYTVRLESPTGSGKTTVACLLAGELQEGPLLFLVNKDKLLRQFVATATKVLGIPKENIGIIKAQKYSIKPITVGSLQTLGKESFDLEAIKHTFTTVFFDECHISTALTYRRVLLGLAPQRLIGLSATPEHYFSDDLNDLMTAMLGPVGIVILEKDVPGRIIPETYTRETGLTFTYKAAPDAKDYIRNKCRDRLFKELAASRPRNHIIFNDCRMLLKAGHKILLAVARINHGKTLYDAFTSLGILASFPYKITTDELYKVDHKKLDADCERIADGEISVLIGTYSLFQTGFDCPELSALVLAAPFSGLNSTAIKQAVGRIQRYSFNKESAVVIDYLDDIYVCHTKEVYEQGKKNTRPYNLLRDWAEDRESVLKTVSHYNHTRLKC
jgi:superfamily II DNA or RNA helicase